MKPTPEQWLAHEACERSGHRQAAMWLGPDVVVAAAGATNEAAADALRAWVLRWV